MAVSSKGRVIGALLLGLGVAGLLLVAREMRSPPGELLSSLPQYRVTSSSSSSSGRGWGNTNVVQGSSLAAAGTAGDGRGKENGEMQVVSGGEETPVGSVHVINGDAPHSLSSSPAAIVRYGDVGIKPAGCTDCPVLDTNAVELQKAKMRENQARIDRLKRVLDLDRERIRKASLGLGLVKDAMASAVFNMKEQMKALDVDMESKMAAAEKMHGPPGDRGKKGYAGEDGRPGRPGQNGVNGQPGRQGNAGGAGPPGPRGDRGVRGPPGRQGIEGPQGPIGRAGKAGLMGLRGPPSRSVDCSRDGGQMYKGVCFKASLLSRNSDEYPSKCRPFTPRKAWTEEDWWELSRMFHESTSRLSSRIDRNRDGGRCDNHKAVMSFAPGEHVKTWVNAAVFSFSPTDSEGGETCNLYNGEGTTAIYACTP